MLKVFKRKLWAIVIYVVYNGERLTIVVDVIWEPGREPDVKNNGFCQK